MTETPRYARFLSTPDATDAAAPFASTLAGQSVLVTGAGGCIGSALVEAIAAASPSRLVLLDASEQNLFQIHRRLDRAHEAILGSVADAGLLESVFSRFRPAIVYHAAALKHVSLLELNPCAAVRNNALGTYALAQAALRHRASNLVLVSTDKAVNPRGIMGASKRLAEFTVAALSGPACRMNAIRLVNVIGSSGSVLPIFQEHIARRQPLPVTHPEATRYFMSLREAVVAILAAGASECSGRILLPELGAPESILDLARFLVARDGNQLPVHFIGLRPGEKLHEEPVSTSATAPGAAALARLMDQLARCVAEDDLAGLIAAVSAAIPEYEPSAVVLAAAAVGKAE